MCVYEKIKAGDQEASAAATDDQWRMKTAERTAGSGDENKMMSRRGKKRKKKVSSDCDLGPRGEWRRGRRGKVQRDIKNEKKLLMRGWKTVELVGAGNYS